MVAVSLLKHVYAMTDYQAKEYSLHYLRTKDDIEVDFALVLNNQVESIIEVKVSDGVPSNSLYYFKEKYNYRGIQLVKFLKYERQKDRIEILDIGKFLAYLYL